MKTEVKFRELPEKVQGFLKRELVRPFHGEYAIRVEGLHTLPEWKDATDDERLAYAEWRYPVGVIFRSIMSGYECKSDGIITDDDYTEKEYIFAGKNAVYNYRTNKWAELISEPEEKPLFKVGDRPQWTPELIKQLPHGSVIKSAVGTSISVFNGEYSIGAGAYFIGNNNAISYNHQMNDYAEILSLPDIKEASPESQQEFVKANPGMQHVEEPKAGDMVDYRFVNTGWQPETAFFTGGFNSKGKPVVEIDDDLHPVGEIRLPQKSEVERRINTLIGYATMGVDNPQAMAIEDVKTAMRSICKWGQANPGKI